jgi:hypothetical protein
LINGPEERTIPGNALSVHPDLPFRGLERFGVSFLSRFEGSQLPSSVLRSVTLVDTPGILSGEKQRMNRGYDFTKVVSWFAEVSWKIGRIRKYSLVSNKYSVATHSCHPLFQFSEPT